MCISFPFCNARTYPYLDGYLVVVSVAYSFRSLTTFAAYGAAPSPNCLPWQDTQRARDAAFTGMEVGQDCNRLRREPSVQLSLLAEEWIYRLLAPQDLAYVCYKFTPTIPSSSSPCDDQSDEFSGFCCYFCLGISTRSLLCCIAGCAFGGMLELVYGRVSWWCSI